jgi:hypothetical protein
MGTLVLALLLSPPAAAAQEGGFRAPSWVGETTFLGLDALTGGLTAGVVQRLKGGSFRDGFARGSLGGAVSYAGRRLAVSSFAGAGLAGRELSAVGASITRNASDARPSLERIFLPVGPVNLYVDRSGPSRVSAKLNLYSAAWVATAVLRPELDLDLGRSLSAGAPVFYAPGRRIVTSDGRQANGMAAGGTILLSGLPGPGDENTIAHERVHVLQADYFFHIWSDPVEGWAAHRTGIGSFLYRYLDVGVVTPLVIGGIYRVGGVTHDDRPDEIEAEFLEDR